MKIKQFEKYYEGNFKSIQELLYLNKGKEHDEELLHWSSRKGYPVYIKWIQEFETNVLNIGRDKQALQDYLRKIYVNGIRKLLYLYHEQYQLYVKLNSKSATHDLVNEDDRCRDIANYCDALGNQCASIRSYVKISTNFEIPEITPNYDLANGQFIGGFDLESQNREPINMLKLEDGVRKKMLAFQNRWGVKSVTDIKVDAWDLFGTVKANFEKEGLYSPVDSMEFLRWYFDVKHQGVGFLNVPKYERYHFKEWEKWEKGKEITLKVDSNDFDWLDFFENLDIKDNPDQIIANVTGDLVDDKKYFSRNSVKLAIEHLLDFKKKIILLPDETRLQFIIEMDLQPPRIIKTESDLHNQTVFQANRLFYDFVQNYKRQLVGFFSPKQSVDQKIDSIIKPIFNKGRVGEVVEILSPFFDNKKHELKHLFIEGYNVKEKLSFNGQGKQLLDVLKQLKLGQLISVDLSKNFEKWISDSFNYISNGKTCEITHSYAHRLISEKNRAAKGNRLIDVVEEDGKIVIKQLKLSNRQQ